MRRKYQPPRTESLRLVTTALLAASTNPTKSKETREMDNISYPTDRDWGNIWGT